MNSEKPLLRLRMEPFGDLPGDQGGVAAGSVVDDSVETDIVFHDLVYDFCRVLDHLQVQHISLNFHYLPSTPPVPLLSLFFRFPRPWKGIFEQPLTFSPPFWDYKQIHYVTATHLIRVANL